MNRLGMVINVSHGSDETISQAIDVSTDPVVATHHGLREFNDIPRTMPTELLKKLAAKGGVIGFQIGADFHKRSVFEARAKRAGKPFWDASGVSRGDLTIDQIDRMVAPTFPMVAKSIPEDETYTLDDYLKVVERAMEIAGEDHVALGTDFDGGPPLPRRMRDIRDVPMITGRCCGAAGRNGESENSWERTCSACSGRSPIRTQMLSIGQPFGRFHIESKLGEGGMGVVYRAFDPECNRTVAIKVLRPDLAGPERRTRFAHEARAITAVQHAHIVAVHEVGCEQGLDFICMEFVEGETLEQRIARRRVGMDEAVAICDRIS